MKEDISQLLPAPKGKTLRQKIDKETEPFQQQILEIPNQQTSFLNPKSQTSNDQNNLVWNFGGWNYLENNLLSPGGRGWR
jgi:hypothetical protein